jgi:hypothetical protein
MPVYVLKCVMRVACAKMTVIVHSIVGLIKRLFYL